MRPEALSSLTGNGHARIDAAIVEQAAAWLVRMLDSPSPGLDQACLKWRQAHPHHELAWQRLHGLQHDLRQGAGSLDPGAAQLALRTQHQRRRSRRQVLAAAMVLGSSAGLAWLVRDSALVMSWRADYRTGAGQQRTLQLSDGTRLVLNTRSAVDIEFTPQERLIRLVDGEILVETGYDPAGRPLKVATRFGDLMPQGTRFTVRLLPAEAEAVLAVQEGAVRVQLAQATVQPPWVQAGEQLRFDAQGVLSPHENALPAGDGWADGMLLANRMPLDGFVAELARYRPGWLQCAPEAAHYQVSGAFPIRDTDAALAMLADIVPIQVQTRTRYWVTVLPKS